MRLREYGISKSLTICANDRDISRSPAKNRQRETGELSLASESAREREPSSSLQLRGYGRRQLQRPYLLPVSSLIRSRHRSALALLDRMALFTPAFISCMSFALGSSFL